LAGLKANSYSIGGFNGVIVFSAGNATSLPKTSFTLLNPPHVLARYEKGFSCSSFFASSISLVATFFG
jgi:hypothetical protein